MAELTYKQREKLPDSAFVFPEERRYPIHDEAHARNAIARVMAHGTPEEQRKVIAAVKRRYPNIDVEAKPKGAAQGVVISHKDIGTFLSEGVSEQG